MAIGTIAPVSIVAFFTFVLASFGNAWSGGSSTEPVATALGVGILALAVLCLPAALLCKGVRGVRPVYAMVLASLALAVGEAVSALAIGWLLVCAVPLYSPDVTEFLRTRRPRRESDADDAAAFARQDRAGVLSLWLFSIGLIALMLFAREQERALACAAGWLATSAWLVAKARPGDSSKWALVPALAGFAATVGFHLAWTVAPESCTDPASFAILASIAETILASAVLFFRHAVASRIPRRLLCAGVVLSTLTLWCATVETVLNFEHI